MTTTKLALYDIVSGGKRIGTVELADLSSIKSISYGQEGQPEDNSHVVTIQLEGSSSPLIVRSLNTTNVQFIQDWSDVVAGGSSQGHQVSLAGNLVRQEIDEQLLSVETKLGSFAFNPTLFPGSTMHLTLVGTLTDGGGAAPSFELRLYDMGAPNTPQAGDLRSTATFAIAGSLRRERGSALLPISALTPLVDEVLDVERIYEIRGFLTGDSGDLMEIDWAGIQGA